MLYRKIIKNNDRIRFHTPGHSGKNLDGRLYRIAKYDLTELSFSDNLQDPEGIIAKSEAHASEVLGVKKAMFFTSGATTAVWTALFAAKELSGEAKIRLVGRAHKSFYSGCRLAGLKTDDNAKTVFLTSPDYLGNTVSPDYVAEMQKKGHLVIADASHGAHLGFSDRLPEGLEKYADLAVLSLHKTMPVLTGGAILTLNCGRLFGPAIKYRAELHTTSPSYPIMASIDYAVRLFERKGAKLYADTVRHIEKALRQLVVKTVKTDDPTRLVLDLGDFCGYYAEGLERAGIYAELKYKNLLVFIVTPYNAKKLRALVKVLKKLKTNEAQDCKTHDTFSEGYVVINDGGEGL